MARMDEWREPNGRERAVIDAALAFNFVGRDELATQLVGARVTDDCVCGCGSFRVERRPGTLPSPADGVALETLGRDDAENEVGLFIKVEGGYVAYVECWGLGFDPIGLPKPESLYLWESTGR